MIEYYKKAADQTTEIYEDLNTRLMNYAAYRTEYEELMNTKKLRGLYSNESKRLQILKSNLDYYDSLRDQDFERLKNSLDLKLISEEEYYTRLADLRDTYFEKGSNEWAKYTIQITKYNSEIIEEQKEKLINMFENVNSEYLESFNALISKQENMKDKLMGISDIYNKISINGAKDGESYTWLQLSNIDTELEALKNYNDALLNVQEKVNSIFDTMDLDEKTIQKMQSMFFEQLAELNIQDATGFSNYLSNMDTTRLSDYLTKWVEKINLSDAISKKLYSDEADNLFNAYVQDISETFESGMEKIFSSVPNSFFETGSLSAYQFGNGFLDVIDDIMTNISNEIIKKRELLIPDFSYGQSSNNIVNNSNYNIYGAYDMAQTILELQRIEKRNRMLVGDG